MRSDQFGNLVKVKWKGKFIYGMGIGKLIYFTVKLISIFSLTVFSSGAKHKVECKTFSDFSLHAKQTQL